jgi:predicted TIM-barrel enzyme
MPRRRAAGERIRLALTVEQIKQSAAGDVTWILCPWLTRYPTPSDVWLSVLAAHDANGARLEALAPSKQRRPNVYAAVFAIDVLRTTAYLIRHIKAAGVGGVINLPSVSFIDGDAGTVLDSLSLGVTRELEFLEACSKASLRIAGVAGSVASAKRLLAAGADFLIVHNGPPIGEAVPRPQLAENFEALARSTGVPIIPMSRLFGGSAG